MDTNALLKHPGMMSQMDGGSKADKKVGVKKKMEMNKKPKMKK